MFAELREQLAAQQFETKFSVGISWGQKTFCPNIIISNTIDYKKSVNPKMFSIREGNSTKSYE